MNWLQAIEVNLRGDKTPSSHVRIWLGWPIYSSCRITNGSWKTRQFCHPCLFSPYFPLTTYYVQLDTFGYSMKFTTSWNWNSYPNTNWFKVESITCNNTESSLLSKFNSADHFTILLCRTILSEFHGLIYCVVICSLGIDKRETCLSPFWQWK